LGYLEEEIAFEVYPNPAGLEVTIKSFGGIDKVLIQDLTGKKVVEKQLFAELETIDISGLKPGIYLVSVCGLQGKQVGKTKSWIKI
jgi:hypothetical protein